MDILLNITDKVQYKIHELTYNPEAEKFAQDKKAAQEAELNSKNAQAEQLKKEKEQREAEVNKRTNVENQTKEMESRNTFSIGRMTGKIFGTTLSIVLVFLIVGGGILGASLATNLNLYREWSYRLLYLVYGFIFFPIVIPYVYLYRWWWKEKRPKYYALFPMIPYHLNHPWAAQFFSWLSYKEDDYVDSLKEWMEEKKEDDKK